MTTGERTWTGVQLDKIEPNIVFAAANARFVAHFPDGPDQLWAADIKACRHRAMRKVFEDILFVESEGAIFVYGIEFEDGHPPGLDPETTAKQQAFIRFLRSETAKNNEAMGALSLVFSGHEFACEAKATAAYLRLRGSTLDMGIGFRNADGEYELIAVKSESWRENGGLTFDELGSDW